MEPGFHVTIPGAGQPQGASRAFVRGERAIITSANPKLSEWRALAVLFVNQAKAKAEFGDPWEGPVFVVVEDHRVRPKAAKKRPKPSVKPDLDKIVRACLDVLVIGGVIRDDAQVCQINAWKVYSLSPEVRLTVYKEKDSG